MKFKNGKKKLNKKTHKATKTNKYIKQININMIFINMK